MCARDRGACDRKEVGWGFSEQNVRDLAAAGVSAIDVAGAGGTSWSQVDVTARQRISTKKWPRHSRTGVFRPPRRSGTPLKARLPYRDRQRRPRTGLDVAKCIALGATLGGLAAPFLKGVMSPSRKSIIC